MITYFFGLISVQPGDLSERWSKCARFPVLGVLFKKVSSRWCLENLAGQCLQTRPARHGLPPQRAPKQLGNGRNTVSRVLFRRRELTEPH